MRPPRTLAVAALAAVLAACASDTRACLDVPLSTAAQATLTEEAEAGRIDFAPVLPCARGRGYLVTSVTGDSLPGAPPYRRLNYVVERRGVRVYVLSETRAPVTSTQIPQGTRRLRVTSGEATAEGFVGASGSGGEMAYLRWRAAGITYEFDATLGPAFSEADARTVAAALLARTTARDGR